MTTTQGSTPLRTKYDVAVVGGGPVGCVAAIAHAQKGARVVVLEADPRAARRFAGEWIHPAGVGVLDALRIGRIDTAHPRTGYGFVIGADDGGGPIELAYERGGVALSAEHHDIVEAVRDRARATPEITFVAHARVHAVDGHVVRAEDRQRGRAIELEAERIVGADGRASVVRQGLGLPDHAQVLSYMACVELNGVRLPHEGFGHVVLGGPGPMLLYRIGEDRVRGCLDVPIEHGPRSRSASFLWDGFAPVMPEGMRDAFRAALSRGPMIWAVNRFRPRSYMGRDHVALVGDAAGHVHPMTAMGLTNGFVDALALAESKTLADYVDRRRATVPEILSNALYHCFRRDDPAATELRSAIFEVLRRDPAERTRTLRIMAGEDPSRRSFGSAFLRMAVHAARRTVERSPRTRDVPARLLALAEWMQWPAAGLLPSSLTPLSVKARASSTRPLPWLDAVMGAPAEGESARRGAERANQESANHESASRSSESANQDSHARESTRARTPDADPTAAIEQAGEALLSELEALALRFNRAPDHELALPAVRRVRAIAAAPMRGAMAARMTMAKRRLAREGLPRVLGLAPGATRDAWCLAEVAELLLLLTSERHEGAPIAGLIEGARALVACEAESGGLGDAPGVPASFASTSLGMRALAATRERAAELPGDLVLAIDALAERTLRWLRGREHGDGAFAPCDREPVVLATAHAVRAALACGAPSVDPAVRRATRFLVASQADDGQVGDLATTTHALLALCESGAPAPDAVSAASRALIDAITEGQLEGEARVDALFALGAVATRRAGRPVLARTSARRSDLAVEARPALDPADWAYCKEALGEVSRTFARPIALLPERLEIAVTLGYLLCRVADTIEDHTAVDGAARDPLFETFLAVLERGEDPSGFAAAFAEIPGHDAELDLARNMARVMRVFSTQEEATRAITITWVAEMARGMCLYTHRARGRDGLVALHTVADLERYCYYVAGTVGHFLTDLFLHELGERATPELALKLREDAESFAAGLQLVNILKDVTDDRARGWSFVPRTVCEAQHLPLESLIDPSRRADAHAAVAPLFDVARARLEGALRYALAIPADQHGVRLFCLLPLWMAARTLVLARGNDAMFVAGAPVKIAREEVETIIAECVQHAGDDAYLRSRWDSLWRAGERGAPAHSLHAAS